MKNMFKMMFVGFILSVVCGNLFAKDVVSSYLETPKIKWTQIGTVASPTLGSGMVGNTFTAPNYAQMSYNEITTFTSTVNLSNTIFVNRPEGFNAVLFRFGSNNNGAVSGFNIYAAWDKTDFVHIATVSLTTGLQKAFGEPTKTYCDNIAISSEQWPTTMKAVSPGANKVALLGYDGCGASHFAFIPVSITSAASETIYIEMTGY